MMILRPSGGGGSAGSSGSGQLSTSRECCTHLTACPCSVVRLLPSLIDGSVILHSGRDSQHIYT